MATIDDFKKLDLRVGKVLEAERVEGSEKLIKMQIDFGSPRSLDSDISNKNAVGVSGGLSKERDEERRQILAGIGKAYAPDDLVGRELVAVVNLETRILMGFESQGMILAAEGDDGPIFLVPEKEVPPGASVR